MSSLVVLFNIPAESGLSGVSDSFELYRAVAMVTVLHKEANYNKFASIYL